MKRGCLCLLLALVLSSLPMSVGAQDTQSAQSAQGTQSTTPPVRQGADDYAYRLTFFVYQKLKGSSDNALLQAADELFAQDKQEQIRRELERRIGAPGSTNRPERYEKLLNKLDRKLSDKKIRELSEELAKKGRGGIARWPWPLCVITGCR
jgi:hypothetical protein